jgi:S-adenosylmethionine-diacylgycerolhomoserine-N-methlytransferase
MSAATESLADAHEAGHARQMDATYTLQRHFYDLTRKYYLLGRDRLIERLNVPPGGHVLEIGCGTARNLALVGRAYPEARLYGLDISAEMLKSADKTMRKHGFTAQHVLALGDAAQFDAKALFGRASFERIFCSYTLSMIPEWEEALQHCCTLLAPGGELHVVDFGQQERLPHWFGALLKGWLARFHVEPRPALFEISGMLGERHGLIVETQQLYRDYARAALLRRPLSKTISSQS